MKQKQRIKDSPALFLRLRGVVAFLGVAVLFLAGEEASPSPPPPPSLAFLAALSFFLMAFQLSRAYFAVDVSVSLAMVGQSETCSGFD